MEGSIRGVKGKQLTFDMAQNSSNPFDTLLALTGDDPVRSIVLLAPQRLTIAGQNTRTISKTPNKSK